MKKKSRSSGKAIRNFLSTVLRSATDLRFFREARGKRLHEVVGHIFILIILFWVLPFSMIFFMNIRSGLDAFIGDMRKHVPADTRFEIKEGKFSNTLDAPLVFRGGPATIIVNTATSTLELGANETGIVIGAEGIVSKESPSITKTITYKDFPSIDITRSGIDEWIGKNARWVIFLVSAIALLVFTAGVSVGYAVYLLFHGFMLWFILKIFKRKMSYAQSFTVAAYAATMPIIVKAVFVWSNTDIGSAATYLYWVILAFIIYDIVKRGKLAHGPKQEEAVKVDKSGK